MNAATLFAASALVLLGAGVTAAVMKPQAREADPGVEGLARELLDLQALRPDLASARPESDLSRHRTWNPDPRDATFQAPPITAEIAWFREDGIQVATRWVARTDRAMQFGRNDAPELFLLRRNPVDPARMSGCEVVHEPQMLLEYTEADLRDEGYGQSWTALAQLGIPADAFSQLRATGEQETAFGLLFNRWIAVDTEGSVSNSLLEVWWSEEYALPLRVLRRQDGKLHEQRLVALDKAASAVLELEPFQRWPDYESIDLMDYREGLQEHSAR